MTRSAEEQKQRDCVVSHLREIRPGYRIIHEINCNQARNRIDVMCVGELEIISIEIKSEKDNLKRLEKQLSAYNQCSHATIISAHQKFFEYFTYNDGSTGFRPKTELDEIETAHFHDQWAYPLPENISYPELSAWKISSYRSHQPDTRMLLDLLWAEELRTIAIKAGFNIKGIKRAPAYKLIKILWKYLTGFEITWYVCATLRARTCPEADDPIEMPENGPPEKPDTIIL